MSWYALNFIAGLRSTTKLTIDYHLECVKACCSPSIITWIFCPRCTTASHTLTNGWNLSVIGAEISMSTLTKGQIKIGQNVPMLQSQRDEKLRVPTNWLLVGWLCGKFWEACAGNCRRFAICPEIALSSVLLLLLTWVTIQPPEYYFTTPIQLAIRPPDYLGLWSTLQPETQSPLSRSMFQLSRLNSQFGADFKILSVSEFQVSKCQLSQLNQDWGSFT